MSNAIPPGSLANCGVGIANESCSGKSKKHGISLNIIQAKKGKMLKLSGLVVWVFLKIGVCIGVYKVYGGFFRLLNTTMRKAKIEVLV